MDNYEAKDNKNKIKLIICIIIIIIIILLLITSCTSSYFGKIGNILGYKEISIIETTNDKKVIVNKDLSFIENDIEITTDDNSYKILYNLDDLKDIGLTCSTSDAEIATCIVKDGYVIVNPKQSGEVTIIADMEANGKIYRAKSTITIKEGKKGIKLSTNNGTIYLSEGNKKNITYNLVGIKGDIKVDVSDESVATATASNGLLKITANKAGKTKITLTTNYLGKDYIVVYNLSVYDESTTTTTKGPSNTTTTKSPGTTTTKVTKLKLGISAKSLEVGKTYTIKVTEGKVSSWSSSDTSIVSVDKNGKITAKKAGNATITAKDSNGNTAKVTIVVTKTTTTTVSVIKLNPTTKTMNVGDTFTPSYSGGTPSSWKSSDTTIVTVDSKGKITAKKAGTATVTVTDKNGNKATIKITVVSSGVETKPIKVSPTSLTMITGSTDNIIVTQGTANKWQSSDTSIVTVDSNGQVKAIKAGTAIITVTDKDGNKATVNVTVNKADVYLSDIIVSVSSENNIRDINFNKKTKTYNITIDSDINKDKITIIGIPENSNSIVEYIYDNDIAVSKLENKELTSGTHTVKVLVTSTEDKTETYTINITKEYSNNTNISSVKINGNNASITDDNKVTYFDKEIKLELEVEDSRSKITKIDGVNIDNVDLDNYPLNEGINEIKVTVEAEDGSTKTHTITIVRPIRTIKLSTNTNYSFNIEDAPYTISYDIYEDNNLLSSLTNKDINEVSITIDDFKGTITKDTTNPGKVVINPKHEDIGTHTIKAILNSSIDEKELTINIKPYYLKSPKYKYDALWSTDNKTTTLVINTDILSYDESGNNYTIDNSNSGNIIIKNNDNTEGKITLSWDSSKANIKFEKNNDGSNSYILKVTLKQKENFDIDVKGIIYGKTINNFQIELNIKEKYILTLDANDGVLNSIGNKKYEYLLESGKEFALSAYEPYKEDDTKNCFIFKFIEWTDSDNNKYQKNDKITISKDTTLVASYESISAKDTRAAEAYYDLINANIFESFNQQYDDKLIYPGLEGAYTIKINNDTDGILKIKQFELQEETLCVSERQCLNMGYAIRKINPDSIDNTYYYGSSINNSIKYEILNKDPLADNAKYPNLVGKNMEGYYTNREIPIDEDKYIEISSGSSVEVVLLWKWVEIDDDLDTKIGRLAIDDNEYILSVRMVFDKSSQYCKLTETQ